MRGPCIDPLRLLASWAVRILSSVPTALTMRSFAVSAIHRAVTVTTLTFATHSLIPPYTYLYI